MSDFVLVGFYPDDNGSGEWLEVARYYHPDQASGDLASLNRNGFGSEYIVVPKTVWVQYNKLRKAVDDL